MFCANSTHFYSTKWIWLKVKVHILCILFILSAHLHCCCVDEGWREETIQQFELCCAYDSMIVSECVIILLWICMVSCLKCLWVILLWLLDSLVYFILPECYKHISVWFLSMHILFVNISCAPKSFDLSCFFFRESVPMFNISLGCLLHGMITIGHFCKVHVVCWSVSVF